MTPLKPFHKPRAELGSEWASWPSILSVAVYRKKKKKKERKKEKILSLLENFVLSQFFFFFSNSQTPLEHQTICSGPHGKNHTSNVKSLNALCPRTAKIGSSENHLNITFL
jgi:hypothetical protein